MLKELDKKEEKTPAGFSGKFMIVGKHSQKLHFFDQEIVYREKRAPAKIQYMLIGYHHGGHEFIKTFQAMKKRFLVIDYDPEVIDILERLKVNYLYGDATDLELLQEAGIENVKMLVTTMIDHEANMFVVNLLREVNPNAISICHANNIQEATELYENGASYVMIPHHLGSEKMSAFIKRTGGDKSEFDKHREKHLTALRSHLSES